MKTAKINKASLVREAKDFLEGGLSQAVLISVNSSDFSIIVNLQNTLRYIYNAFHLFS